MGTTNLCGEMADTCLQQIVLYTPAHQIVVNRRPTDTLEVRDSLVVVVVQCSQVRNFEEVLVRKAGNGVDVS